jgi:bifunctional DNA-binding transcriptional regulator/antitoxin component of YhaV-PrlF toxin-antitoxin module
VQVGRIFNFKAAVEHLYRIAIPKAARIDLDLTIDIKHWLTEILPNGKAGSDWGGHRIKKKSEARRLRD